MSFNKIELSGRFEFFEEASSPLKETENFFVGATYEASFKFKNDLPFSRELQLSDKQFKFENNANSFKVAAKGEQSFKIIFSPEQAGSSNFLLILAAAGKEPRVELLSRHLNVIKATEKIEGRIEKGLPASMKLGQTADVIFLFTNKGDQAAHGINIEVKQIEA